MLTNNDKECIIVVMSDQPSEENKDGEKEKRTTTQVVSRM